MSCRGTCAYSRCMYLSYSYDESRDLCVTIGTWMSLIEFAYSLWTFRDSNCTCYSNTYRMCRTNTPEWQIDLYRFTQHIQHTYKWPGYCSQSASTWTLQCINYVLMTKLSTHHDGDDATHRGWRVMSASRSEMTEEKERLEGVHYRCPKNYPVTKYILRLTTINKFWQFPPIQTMHSWKSYTTLLAYFAPAHAEFRMPLRSTRQNRGDVRQIRSIKYQTREIWKKIHRNLNNIL